MRGHDWKNDPARECEDRPERPERMSHVVHPNGSLVDSWDPNFIGGAARLVLELHEAEAFAEVAQAVNDARRRCSA